MSGSCVFRRAEKILCYDCKFQISKPFSGSLEPLRGVGKVRGDFQSLKSSGWWVKVDMSRARMNILNANKFDYIPWKISWN